MSGQPFSSRAAPLLAALSAALFAGAVLLHVLGGEALRGGGRPADPGSRSPSALGHAGWHDVLRRLGRRVGRAYEGKQFPARGQGLRIAAEPRSAALAAAADQAAPAGEKLLLVLPKWLGRPDPARPEWIADRTPLPLAAAEEILIRIAPGGAVFRQSWPAGWSRNDLPFAPSGSGPAQLFRAEGVLPLVADGDGILLGRIDDGGREVWILSDPDAVANLGMLRGDNAAFAVALADAALRSGERGGSEGLIVFDETVHGFGVERTGNALFMRLLEFPGAAVAIQAALAALLLLWAGAGRFGAPAAPGREIDFGKRRLIMNGARLLDYAGHQPELLRHYVRLTLRSAARALHAPPGLDEAAALEWLDRVGRARGVACSCRALAAEAGSCGDRDAARLLGTAAAAHRWREEIIHGTAGTGRNARGHAD